MNTMLLRRGKMPKDRIKAIQKSVCEMNLNQNKATYITCVSKTESISPEKKRKKNLEELFREYMDPCMVSSDFGIYMSMKVLPKTSVCIF